MNIEISGSVEVALTHFAMYGLGLILSDSGARRVRVWWADGPEARATVAWEGDSSAAEVLQRHAAKHHEDDSWVQATFKHKFEQKGAIKDTIIGLFSPRIPQAVSADAWQALEKCREKYLDDPSLTKLDRLMIGALGEPAHWLCGGKDNQPDLGATRWEMKTRNRGEEFVQHRLAPLAHIVAGRSLQQIDDGLTGTAILDELGKNSPGSRTGTGFSSPGPVDSALAWCALWGISLIPLVPQVGRMSQTAGTSPRRRVHPDHVALPVFTRPTSLDLWRAILASAIFDRAAFGQSQTGSDVADPRAADVASARATLRERGVAGLVRFPVRVDNPNAPERSILWGVVDPLADS
ncbi:hypothetical protein [Raineyella sp. W15-4]|uniref:hypothetical protein n=1 Tax=Raineyella sp. W15-4 TaxID=3081651 RepID=UPI0029540B6D|nr:hypothetical protein [Raineyella sp. W15-4]WOQ16526.1 hypothetical protein R0145_15165 [Raineyella sp. W15-4]